MKKLYIGLLILLIVMGFVFLAVLQTKHVREYWSGQNSIKLPDSICMEVFKMKYLNGCISFNGEAYIKGSDVTSSDINLYEMVYFTTPFTVRKKSSNDTIWIIREYDRYYVVIE